MPPYQIKGKEKFPIKVFLKGGNQIQKAAVFSYIEKKFDEWMEQEDERGGEARDMYSGEDSIYDRKGAILQAYESIKEELENENLEWGYLHNFDIEASFQ